MHFFSGGGFPFGGMSHDDDDDQQANTNQYYQILGVSKNATQEQIKKSYKELSKKYHPDKKGGDSAKFTQISQAYQTLSDPNKRQIYDKYGKNGPSSQSSDIMDMFFGGGGGRRRQKQTPKVKATRKALEITLEDIYKGCVKKVPHMRTRNCEECNGKGGEGVQKCKPCKGRGQITQMYQMGPSMYQQIQKQCDKCNGEGEIIKEGGKCKKCLGKKIIEKQKVVEVAVDKGVPDKFPITCAGEGNQIPGALAGDLVFVTVEQPHALYTRKGADLFIKHTIKLLDALTGFEMKIKHLDGREYTLYTGKGEVIGDSTKKTVRGLGLPFFKDPMSHGNLVIEFQVQMPKRGELTKEQLEGLAKLLPGKVHPRPTGNYQMLEDFDLESVNTNEEGGRKAQEEEQYEQEEQGGCSAQ